jgi:hypothetical protein
LLALKIPTIKNSLLIIRSFLSLDYAKLFYHASIDNHTIMDSTSKENNNEERRSTMEGRSTLEGMHVSLYAKLLIDPHASSTLSFLIQQLYIPNIRTTKIFNPCTQSDT